MRRTIKIKADFPKEIVLALLKTSSEVFNDHVAWAFDSKSYNKNKSHREIYSKIRDKYPNFPTGLLQSVRDMALESVKRDKFRFCPKKKPGSGLRIDKRCSNLENNTLIISTLGDRIKTKLVVPKYHQDVFYNWKFTGLQLTYNSKQKQVYVSLNFKKESPETISGDVLGIDRGLKNIVMCSSKKEDSVSGQTRNRIKRRYTHLRKQLQTKCTPSAKRRLRQLSGREARFSLNENHIIANQIVKLPYSTFVLEKLKGIRKRKSKSFNRKIANWSYYQFEQILAYKSEAIGKMVRFIDPRYTSQKCSSCGHIDCENRNQSEFLCTKCEYKEDADFNAAINIRDIWCEYIAKFPKGQADVKQPKVLPGLCLEATDVSPKNDSKKSVKKISKKISRKKQAQSLVL